MEVGILLAPVNVLAFGSDANIRQFQIPDMHLLHIIPLNNPFIRSTSLIFVII